MKTPIFFATLITHQSVPGNALRTSCESQIRRNRNTLLLHIHTWIHAAPDDIPRSIHSSGITSDKYAGTGARSPRASTWQYLHTPIPVLLSIHLVSYSRQRPQYTVCPFHFRHWLMCYRAVSTPHKNVGINGSINQG
jgi:hypothetical protein